jgi:hypothetical protein
MQSLRGRGGSRAAGRRSCGSGDIGFRSAGSSRRDGAVTSGQGRSLFRNFGANIASILSFLFILAGVRAFSVLSIILLLRLADVPDEGLSVSVVHVAMG